MPRPRRVRSRTNPYASLVVLLVMVCVAVSVLLNRSGWLSDRTITTKPSTTIPTTASVEDEPWMEVFFTQPDAPQAQSKRGGADASLAEAIDRARLSVDLAMYNLNLWNVRDALLNAHRRGVTVRMVTESDNLDMEEIQTLKEHGIPVLGDRREGLMHNKFVVIDRLEVWTGSMNLTVSDAYRNDNNLVRIRSTQLAENYLTEFEEMFRDDQFGTGSPANTPHPTLTENGTTLQVYFSPEDGVAQYLLALIGSAKESIHFLAYSLTSEELATALIERASQGIAISGVFEKSQYLSNVGSEYDRMQSAGLDVHLDGNPQQMHHKVLIVDGWIVVTGSYNFTNSAETRNDENVLILYSQAIAEQFLKEYRRLFEQAQR